LEVEFFTDRHGHLAWFEEVIVMALLRYGLSRFVFQFAARHQFNF